MRLKRLELFGFKSFADRTVFEFGGNTLTGVVGPNGCGKSNVVDSVRWVLGEQRPTSMRGAEMTDVIFKGSASRPSLSVAEVTLILDNAQGVLEGHGAEVAITRRVFKSGEGEYLLDGEKVRLKDVREMLFDTGLGSRGYSVLEQGKIDAVLSVNPLERRRIFEEAAGISRYRQRKIETELRLKRVADDMTRLGDVLGELSTRVRSLKIQAGKAERFVEAKAQWTRERTRYFKHRVWLLTRDVDARAAALDALDARAAALKEQRSRSETDVAERERERNALAAEVDRLVQESGRLAGDGRALDERRAHVQSRVASANSAFASERERAGVLERTLAERRAEIEALARAVEALREQNRGVQERSDGESRALRELEIAWREVRANCERQNDAVLALLHQRTEAENRVRTLAESRGPAAERGERIAERVEQARAAVSDMQRAEAAALADLTDSQAAQQGQDQLRRELAQNMAETAAEVAAIDKEKNSLELERTRAQSRIEFLLDRERDLEELSKAARRVLESVQKSAQPCTSDELIGLVADHLRTDTEHARALDAVLGLRGGALVARDRESALKVAAWLKSSEAGQVGLVLPNGVARADRRAPEELGSDEQGLVDGRLRDHVRCASEYAVLADLLCGDVLVARDLSSALVLVERHPERRCVTREGEFVDAAGIIGGARSLAQGAVGRRSSAADLRREVERSTRDIQALDARRAELALERTKMQKEWERSSQELEARRQARAQAESALSTARARLRDLEAALRALESESGALGAETERIERELAARRTELDDLRAAFEAENEKLGELELSRRELEEQREERARASSQADVEAARTRTELEGSLQRQRDLERACADNQAELERATRLCDEHAEALRAGAIEAEELAHKCGEILEERGRLDGRLRAQREAASGGHDAIEAMRKRVELVTRELENASQELGDERLAAQRLELERAELLRRAQDELALEANALLHEFTPEPELTESAALEALDREVRECKARLDKIGPVNVEAVAELSEAGARLDFLETQRRDLAESRDALMETVRTIDAESKRLFLETFEEVRTNFQRIFRQLFGGGRADVQLEEGLDVLDAGVEIVARPPGRELLSIGLLSGGQRTLTALALLFAVFEARPSPFCILDEVDAALDDANVDRFLAMLDGFRQSTQFIVVTHNKGTMSACESLYGVTMETKGVSRQVSVELGDVDRWAKPVDPDSAGATEARSDSSVPPAIDPEIDSESGEPVVELVPTLVDGAGELRAPKPLRRAERRARAKPERDIVPPSGAEIPSAPNGDVLHARKLLDGRASETTV
jgi:chromosome segregation protein